mmetsp:Transcript_62168/g.115368  ORF Transcript_62168/g.115368 Transcript_62168/m.115368 type:complete len:248 (+) Transcript_62168:169-912(+)
MCMEVEARSSSSAQTSSSFRSLAELQRDFWRQQQDLARSKLAKDIQAVGAPVSFNVSDCDVHARNAVIGGCGAWDQPRLRSTTGRGRNGLRKAASEATSQAASREATLKDSSARHVDTTGTDTWLRTYDRSLLLSYRPLVSDTEMSSKFLCAMSAEYESLTADPTLDDEVRIGMLETRLSAESCADALNFETFGEEAARGWSFEEAVKANQLLNGGKDWDRLSADTTTVSSGEPSEWAASTPIVCFQ